ncbi:FCS-Like Zinc finger 2-like [Hordeum vulgare subsp. vulgare]|uniref:FLZ-type domain-containing protein n=1 Tax=Hordeum vulgare subsp. vulgare TaxID=112509 RepID=A0A8I6YU62_HORVV|nr:FCS-Like Zinc finger 2-like [Hordeum vulgare subsp. vulgare]
MEDFYYFPTSLETSEKIHRAFLPVVHSSPHNRSSPSPRPRRDAGELGHHYLNACFRCGRTLSGNKDIFMYRGDTPFCSEECRQQQIDTDDAAEKRSKKSAAATATEQQSRRHSPHRVPVWAR